MKIKFRAWDRINKRWFFFDLGDLALTDCGDNIEGYGSKGNTIYANYGDLEDEQQFTGLKDKDEKEIYGGDILRIKQLGEFIGKVIFKNGGFYCGRNPLSNYISHIFKIKIIGNKFKNTELLEEINKK